MRGMIEGLDSPHPLGMLLPALYHDDDFAQGLTGGLDAVLAPIFLVLDGIEAYVDPLLAPSDFVEWLAAWVGVELDASWPEERQRELVARAPELLAWNGTARGLAMLVEIYTGQTPELVDSGGTAWSPTPDGDLPGGPAPSLTVRLRVPDPASVDTARLERLVARAKPAEVAHQVEVLAS